jgi:hypothetical protein
MHQKPIATVSVIGRDSRPDVVLEIMREPDDMNNRHVQNAVTKVPPTWVMSTNL